MTDLRSAPVPALRTQDHVRGPDDAPLLVVYADFACPRCALTWDRLRAVELRVCFRHFALQAKHARAVPLARAAEAAARQGAFWEFHDRLYADPGRQDDPHLWAHARDLGLDVDRFEADRRADDVAARVQEDVHGALRAGATATPTLFVGDALHAGAPEVTWLRALR